MSHESADHVCVCSRIHVFFAAVKRQALLNLHMMLDDDSKRQKLVQQAAPNSISSKKAGQTAAAVAETSATVSLTLQQHLQGILASLVDGRDSLVRHAALTLTSAMLREGLAHPMACLPKVIALEVDVKGCADLAKAELRKHFDRYAFNSFEPVLRIRHMVCNDLISCNWSWEDVRCCHHLN